MARKRRPPVSEPEAAKSVQGRVPIASLNLPGRTVNMLENQATLIFCDQITRLSKEEIQTKVIGLGDKVLATLALALDSAGIPRPKDWIHVRRKAKRSGRSKTKGPQPPPDLP